MEAQPHQLPKSENDSELERVSETGDIQNGAKPCALAALTLRICSVHQAVFSSSCPTCFGRCPDRGCAGELAQHVMCATLKLTIVCCQAVLLTLVRWLSLSVLIRLLQRGSSSSDDDRDNDNTNFFQDPKANAAAVVQLGKVVAALGFERTCCCVCSGSLHHSNSSARPNGVVSSDVVSGL